MPRKVLSVGQCDFDNDQIRRLLMKHFECEVVCVKSHKDAESELTSGIYDLVLVNRINDSDGSEGMRLIESMNQNAKSVTPVMLVSNFEEAQSLAVSSGAVRGFGKSELDDATTVEKLKPFLVPQPD